MRTTLGRFVGVALVLGSSSLVVSQGSSDWPQFRGPSRNGVAPALFEPKGLARTADAKQLWQRPADPVVPQWGAALSPLVDRGLVIVHVGGTTRGH